MPMDWYWDDVRGFCLHFFSYSQERRLTMIAIAEMEVFGYRLNPYQ